MDNTQDISQEEWEQLESYVQHSMTPEERAAFEAKLSADASLQAKLTELQLLMMGINEAVLKERLQTFHLELPAKEEVYSIRRQKSSALKTWLIAASILLIAGVGGWLLLQKSNSESNLFAAYFKPDPGLITAMSATDNYAFEKAMIDYKSGDYDAAIQAWDSLQKAQPANDTLNYFLGVAHLANEQAAKAANYLKKVTASEGFFTADAHWYLSLALLKEGKREEAAAVLQKASHPDKDALLQKLKE